MKNLDRDSIDFGKTDIPKLFRSIFIPTLFGMVFNAVFVFTDGVFIGHDVGPEGLACVNLIAPIMMVITGLGMMFGVGCSVVSAIHLSRDNEKAARINTTQAYLAATLLAILMAVLFYSMPGQVLHLLGVPDSLIPMAKEYYLWFIPTALFLMFQIVGEFLIRLDGSPKFAMFSNIIPAVVNIILDYVFIFPCSMGLKGAALATDIGTGIGMLMALYYMVFRAEKLKFYRLKRSATSLRLSVRNVGYMIKLGFSAFIGEFAISTMMLAGNIAFGQHIGDDGIAAYSVICYLFPVVYMIYSAVAQSAQPIISYNYGASQGNRVRKTFRFSLMISVVFGAVITFLFCFSAPAIISIFLENGSETFRIATEGLPLYATGFVFIAFNVSAIGYFQSIERGNLATCLMLLRGVIFLVMAFWILPKAMGTTGLWLAVPTAEVLTFAVEIFFFARKKQ